MPLTDESKKEEPTLSELFPITDINISKVPLSKDEIESRTKIQVGWTPEHEEMFEKSGLERYKGQYNMSDMESHVWTWRGLIERDAHDKPYIEQMNAMAEKLAQDPLFTPHREDVINIFKNMEDDTRWPTFLMNKGIFELYTQEFIEKLTDYLTQQAQKYRGGGKCRILEVGAGSGKLALLLKQRLPENIEYIATDIGDDDSGESYGRNQYGITEIYPIQKMDSNKALEIYKPDIVVSSYMPPNEDWTASFRAIPSVNEYILIGIPNDTFCGKTWETWGLPDSYSENTLIPPYEKEGFQRIDLENELGETQLGRGDRFFRGHLERYGYPVSFQRVKTA